MTVILPQAGGGAAPDAPGLPFRARQPGNKKAARIGSGAASCLAQNAAVSE